MENNRKRERVEEIDLTQDMNESCTKLLSFLDRTHFYLIEMIDENEVTIGSLNWLNLMEQSLSQRKDVIKNLIENDQNLSEAYFYYGLMAHSRGELTKLHESITHFSNAQNAFKKVIEISNKREIWKLEVIQPLLNENNGWLNIFLKCGLTKVLKHLFYYSENWSKNCTPDHKLIFNCFNFKFNDLKAIVFGESPLPMKSTENNKNTGFAFQTSFHLPNGMYKHLPQSIKNILTALTKKYFNFWDNHENENSVKSLIISNMKTAIMRYGLRIDEFSRENKFLFLNIRLTHFEDIDSKSHRDLWDNFFCEVLQIVIKTNRTHKLNVYQIFYSPKRSPQEEHKIRNLLQENEEHIEIFDLKPMRELCDEFTEEMCHISKYNVQQINNLAHIFEAQTIFYELISFHLIEAILNVYEEAISEQYILSLNQFFINHFEELLNSAIKFKSVYEVLDKILENDYLNFETLKAIEHRVEILSFAKPENEFYLSFWKRIKYLKEEKEIYDLGLTRPFGKHFYIRRDYSEVLKREEHDINSNKDFVHNFKRPLFIHSLRIEVQTKHINDYFVYSVAVMSDKLWSKIINDSKANDKTVIIQKLIPNLVFSETTHKNANFTDWSQLTRIMSYKIHIHFDIRDFLRESQIIPNLIENCDHCIQIIQIKFKSGANVSLGNRIYGNHAVFNVGLVEWEQVFKYQTMFLIDADINCDPNCVSIHWLIANMKKNKIESGDEIIRYTKPRFYENSPHRYVVIIYGHNEYIHYYESIPNIFYIKSFASAKNLIPICANFFLY